MMIARKMGVAIKRRDNFDGIDPARVPYLRYALADEKPDFSNYTIGSRQEITLCNLDTGELERIEFVVKSDNGLVWPQARRVWGDIVTTKTEVKHCCLCFYLTPDQQDIDRITASFCGQYPSLAFFQKRDKALAATGPLFAARNVDYTYFERRERLNHCQA